MKKILVVLLALAMVFSMAACGKKEAEDPKVLEDSLVIYTTHAEALVQAVADAFEAETGVKVEFINLKGELASRVEAEKDNPQADIMYGGDSAIYQRLKAEGCYAVTAPAWAGDLNPAFKDAEGYFYGTIKTPVMMFYNTEKLSADQAPKDWADLIQPQYLNQIVTRDSLSSSMKSCMCALIYHYGEDNGFNYLKDLDINIKNYYNSGSMMYEAVGKGEATVSIAVLSDIVSQHDKGLPFEAIDAVSGSPILTDCIAALNKAPHPNAAAAFVEFAGSAKVQAMLAKDFNKIPSLDAALADSPAWMATSVKPMDLDWSVISQNQTSWLNKWETDVINTSKNLK
ncbi:MAG: extracellular solute-binding protein [Clostridia bacterium]|nr:extracellular solute-binding protein [Clostridia bacterium]